MTRNASKPTSKPVKAVALRAESPCGKASAAQSVADAGIVFAALIEPYLVKLASEREARLAGRVVEADFALRQATVYEIALDLAAGSNGEIGMEALRSACASGKLSLEDVAESPLSKLLGDARRALWAELAAPHRPDKTGEKLLQYDPATGLVIEPAELIEGGKNLLAQKLALQERHEEAARAQVAWEAGNHAARGNTG